MRNKNWDLVFVIIGILNIAFSFAGNNTIEVIFGFEINIWTYRTIWGFIAVGSFLSYRKKKKLESEANDQK
jgi:hypothetical protein|tara:strand:+ start:746 stop:958 length:213 start_codon:yes stop_codon:yes gene_type:complete